MLSDLGWRVFFREDVVQYQVIPIGLAGAWLLAGIYFSLKARTDRTPAGGRGIAYAIPCLVWSAATVLQALEATQVDIVVVSSRFLYCCVSIMIGLLAGVLVTFACLATFRLRTGSKLREVPNGVWGITAAGWVIVVGAWCVMLLRELRIAAT